MGLCRGQLGALAPCDVCAKSIKLDFIVAYVSRGEETMNVQTILKGMNMKVTTQRGSTSARIAKALTMVALAGLSLSATVGAAIAANAAAVTEEEFKFELVRSPGLAAFPNCLANARGKVKIESRGPVEEMRVSVEGLPADTDFDLFVIQQPNAPFGMAWYQGDVETNKFGRGYGRFIGRFNKETFIVAPGAVPAPSVHSDSPFPDATLNPKTAPIHTLHIGLWFNSPQDAVKAGCPANVTPFNGDHNAGVQVLNTSNFPDLQGPLLKVKP